jgi:hypothetical protein
MLSTASNESAPLFAKQSMADVSQQHATKLTDYLIMVTIASIIGESWSQRHQGFWGDDSRVEVRRGRVIEFVGIIIQHSLLTPHSSINLFLENRTTTLYGRHFLSASKQ